MTNTQIEDITYETIFNHVLEGIAETENKIGKIVFLSEYDIKKFSRTLERLSEIISDNLKR